MMLEPQSVLPKEKFFFKEVKNYADYLLEQKLGEFALENVRLLRANKLPLLKFFSHLTEDQLLALIQQSLEDFLQDIKQDIALEKALLGLQNWKMGQMPGEIPRAGVEVADLVLAYSIRKQLFLAFLPDYTSDCQQVVAIMQELEAFHVRLERAAFDVFVAIQQEELSLKNDFLASLINTSEDAILAFDSQQHVTEWNAASEVLLKKKKEEVCGHTLVSVFPRLKGGAFLAALEKALQGERIQLVRQPYLYADGYYDGVLVPLFSPAGAINGVLAVLHDVSETVANEDRLREHQEELQASNEEMQESLAQLEEAQETLSLAIEQLEEAQAIARLGNWEYDISRNLVFWSKEMRRIFGYTEDALEISYETYLEHVFPDDRGMVTKIIADCSQTHQPYTFEHRITTKTGEIRWLQANGKVVLNAQGQLCKMMGTGLDITERKLAERKVQEEQHFIQKVTDTTPDVITVFDLEKRVNIYGNRELFDVLGYSPEEVEELRRSKGSQWVYSLLHPEDLPRFFAFIEGLRSYAGSEPQEIEYRGKNRQGDYLWVLGRYGVFKRNSKGETSQIIGITRNISERKKAEALIRENEAHLLQLNQQLENQVAARTAELSLKNQQLLRINTDLDNFIYTASHDLKAPIANLEGLLSLLDGKIKASLDGRELDLLRMMHQSINRFKRTIKDLTDIAQLQKELEEEAAETVSLPLLLDDIKADISQLLETSGAQLQVNLQVEEFGYNLKNLRSILHNLVTNAIKYRQPDVPLQIALDCCRIGEYVQLRIADNGQGIAEKHQDKIFSLFKRLHKDVEGSGMGLYIVKRIVENSGGRIEVNSEVGKGATFTLYLKDLALYEK